MKFDGTYGPPRHRRQRYRCFPADGSRPHVFTDELPREEAWGQSCDICERPVQLHEGPHAARTYQFVARGIAGSLKSVGAGASYMRTARVARQRAYRERVDLDTGRRRESAHGQLVADSVEVFAPVVFEEHRPQAWPASGTLVMDHFVFRVRDPNNPKRSVTAFDVFCALGYADGRPRLWRLEAFPDATARSWETCLRRLSGMPPRVVCDAHHGMLAAIGRVWPQTDLYLCEWHLKHALNRLLHAQRFRHASAVAALQPQVETAFTGLHFWRPFVTRARAAGIPSLDAWLDINDPILQWQFTRRGVGGAGRRHENPLSTGGLEQLTKPICDSLHPRRYALKNRERTNRLLMLMQLHANGHDSETAYAKAIRGRLAANAGRPRTRRRGVTDPLGIPSLR